MAVQLQWAVCEWVRYPHTKSHLCLFVDCAHIRKYNKAAAVFFSQQHMRCTSMLILKSEKSLITYNTIYHQKWQWVLKSESLSISSTCVKMEALREGPSYKHTTNITVGQHAGRWKKISDTVKKLGAFSHVTKKRRSQNSLEELESKFYSEETKRNLSHHNSSNDLYIRRAPHYTQPSLQADSLGDIPQIRRRGVPLPPINPEQAINKRIRRKRSMVFTNSYQHMAVAGSGSRAITPKVLTDGVSIIRLKQPDWWTVIKNACLWKKITKFFHSKVYQTFWFNLATCDDKIHHHHINMYPCLGYYLCHLCTSITYQSVSDSLVHWL